MTILLSLPKIVFSAFPHTAVSLMVWVPFQFFLYSFSLGYLEKGYPGLSTVLKLKAELCLARCPTERG